MRAGGIVFVGQVDAVADAVGHADVDGLVDVELQAFRRHVAQRQLARVQGDLDLRVDCFFRKRNIFMCSV